MAYVGSSTHDLVLSREAMTDLGMVAPSIDDSALVKQLSVGAEELVAGGQLTKDLLVSHNKCYPNQKVGLSDLRPSVDPGHLCSGSEPLKNGFMTCGCRIRAEAPDAMTHKDVANFDNLSVEALRKKNLSGIWLLIIVEIKR